MTKPDTIPQKAPHAVELEAGKPYAWCSCALSGNQPFCDASHKGTGFKSVILRVEESGTHYLCGCKQTDNPPFCDGTHNSLD